MLVESSVRHNRRRMEKRTERERLRMMQNRRVLLERVQLREVRGTGMMTLEIVMTVRRRIHRIEAAMMMVMMVVVLMSHLRVQMLQLWLSRAALVLNS